MFHVYSTFSSHPQKGIDKEIFLLAKVFDENKSHLLETNIELFIGESGKVDKEDPNFQKSNKMACKQ